ncbi:MAG: hypothetical protein LBD99_04670 [Candidatus Margulisbacteria bacterium]|jgi:flagellar basal-body rod protein FlgG|nr:hypothetical protein [Candidatus Margulisiibacteriota bacterium]
MNKLLQCSLLLCAGFLLASQQNKSTVQALSSYEDQYGALMNNVVNANTPGYRATKIITRAGEDGSLYTEELPLYFRNGQMIYSGDQLHMAIEGPGFFMVQTPRGVMFTRDGRFTINDNLILVTLSGKYPVMGQNGEIQFGMTDVDSVKFQVTDTGLLVQQDSVIDKIQVGEIAEGATMLQVNGTFFEINGGMDSFIPLETPHVRQYYYESSNVDMSEELVAMPDISKKYDANAKVLQILKKIRTTGREMGSTQ